MYSELITLQTDDGPMRVPAIAFILLGDQATTARAMLPGECGIILVGGVPIEVRKP
jgi:hypothetical protein